MRLSNKMISLLILQNFYFIIIYFINNKYLRVISHLVKTSLERILSHFTHTHTNIKDITNTTMHTPFRHFWGRGRVSQQQWCVSDPSSIVSVAYFVILQNLNFSYPFFIQAMFPCFAFI